MNRKLKFIIIAFLVFIISSVFTVFCSAEIISGHLDQFYNEDKIVNNDWVLDTEDGTLTITSRAWNNNYNETGACQSKFEGSWYEHKAKIKKVILEGEFRKITKNAFAGYENLTEVGITDGITVIEKKAFFNCPSLKTIYIVTEKKRFGMADFRNISKINEDIILWTAIESINISPAVNEISPSYLPSGLKAVFGEKGTYAEAFALLNGLTFNAPINVNVFSNDYLCMSLSYYSGDFFDKPFFEYNGKIYTVYSDKSCTIPFDNTKPIETDLKLYAKPLLSFVGWSIRTYDYKGLRSIFEYDTTDHYSFENIAEVGVIVAGKNYALDDFNIEESNCHKILIYENGNQVGRLLGKEQNNKVNFAVTVTGFEDNAEKFAYYALSNIVYRGFITVKDKETGKTTTLYTDSVGTTFRAASQQYLKHVEGTPEEIAFVKETITKTETECNEVRYDKEMLTSLLCDVYNDNGKLLVGEQINKSMNPWITERNFYISSGQNPSILGVDLASYGVNLGNCSDSYRNTFIKDLIYYCRSGGIVTISSHFRNPTGSQDGGNLPRGDLGPEEMWHELLRDGSELNKQFKKELDIDAKFLRELKNNGVPVLWRPFHEMNGDWFWWCVGQSEDYVVDAQCFIDLWRYVHNYFENEHGLTNLIWVFSPNNDHKFKWSDVDYAYPGDEYVDITGLDWYTEGKYEIKSAVGAYNKMMAHGMPAAITEYGSGGILDSLGTWEDIQKMYDDGMKVAYILSWCAEHTFGNVGKSDEFMNKPDTLSKEEVYNLFKEKEVK